MDYRSIIESRYNRLKWQELLFDIFRNKAHFWQQPQRIAADESMAKSAYYTGKIDLPDGHTIAVYEVELNDNVVIERNRAGIRNLLCSSWRGMGCSGAFMFCFRQNEAVLRFSYVSESFTFAEDGSLRKDSTDTKRFTYLLGDGHRSRTAIQQFEKLKASGLTLKDITKAFSVEAISDLFFREYKKQYEDIIEFVTGKRMVKVANKWEELVTGLPCREIMQEFSQFPDAEKAVRDYVKKLMGRLVFIQFLQKKGWMGCSAGEAWNDGDREFVQNLFAHSTHKNTFVDDVLEPLFADINTKRTGDIASNPNVGIGIKIPYLNGGLFEKDEYDKTNFPLPAKYMKNLLDFFASYNFTIDENDPDDAEIGVDPEMLGRIFENLLEDNKDKGAFYTPKEIVQYMCRESLIAYLQTDVEDEAVKSQIREFVATNDADLLSADLAASIDQKLKDVKICDPAIGSGAFPMGLLRELYACRKTIEGIDDDTAVSIKTHIIQQNIYGVDIEKGAVDIARLRFWLALIVDEKTPHALPNMDFKIMQGNSLLEQYEGIDLSGMSLDEQKKRRTRVGDSYQTSLAFDEKLALENIQKAIKQYYLTDSHDVKLSLRKIIDDNVKSYILNLKGCTPDIQRKLENLPIPNDKFFLWHIYFKEVFDDGGFDIVIGNPPYGELRDLCIEEQERDKSSKYYKYAMGGRVNLFQFFYPLAQDIAKQDAIICLIVQNSLLAEDTGKKNRQFIFENSQILRIDSFPERHDVKKRVFENVTMSVCVGLIKNTKLTDYPFVVNTWGEKQMLNKKSIQVNKSTINNLYPLSYIIPTCSKVDLELLTKIKSRSNCILTVHAGEIDKTKYKSLFTQNTNEVFCLGGSNIAPYYIHHSAKDVYLSQHVIDTLSRSNLQGECRLVMQRITGVGAQKRFITALLSGDNFMCVNSVNYILESELKLPAKFILALLNSKLLTYYDNLTDTNANITAEVIGSLPIAKTCPVETQKIITLVDSILAAKKANPLADTIAEEREIDHLVYHLYDLTYDEVLIVDPETPITREQYESFE